MKISSFQSALIVLACIAIPCLCFGQTGAPGTTPDPAQLAADQAACQEQAKAASGYDPANPQASAQASVPPPQRGAGLKGAARGAAKGAIVGGAVEVAGDDKDYDDAAEIGAGVGAVAGGVRGRQQAKQQAATQQNQAVSAGASAYTKSYNACMTSRGYKTD